MRTPLVKIIVFVPLTHLSKLQESIGNKGFGTIGEYSHCSFVSEGKGYFMPGKQAHPAIGSNEKLTEVAEAKLEFLCYESEVEQALRCIKDNHPYEEVAFDIIALSNHQYRI